MTVSDFLADKYRCCCGCMHVATGTKIICGITLFECFISAFVWFITGGPLIWGDAEIARIFVTALVAYGPIAGINKNKPLLFIGYLAFLVIFMIASWVALICLGAAMDPEKSELGYEVRKWIENLFKEEHITPKQLDNVIAFFGGLCLVAFGVAYWFFSVVYRCFKYVWDKTSAGYDNMYIIIGKSDPSPNQTHNRLLN